MDIDRAIATTHTDEELQYCDFLEDNEVTENSDFDAPILNKKAQNRMDHQRKCRKERNSDTLKFNRRRRVGMKLFPASVVIYDRSKAKKNFSGHIRAYVADASVTNEYYGNPWYDPVQG